MENESEIIQKSKINIKNFIFIALILLILSVFTIYILYKNTVVKSNGMEKEIEFEINSGESISTISNNLKQKGVIGSPLIFKAYLKLNNLDKNIQAGSYTIPGNISIKTLAMILQHGKDDVIIIYIEGWRIEELAMVLDEDLKNVKYKDFVVKTKKYEGMLFPDTYFFNKDISTDDVINSLSENFETKTKDLLSVQNLKKLNLTKEQALIFASIVEREAAETDDRKLIAGILIKRYQEDMKLDADATTQYAVALPKFCKNNMTLDCLSGENKDLLEDINWWPHNLTKNDLEFDSPYNTRKNIGLPPAPISSFGLDSLESVVNFAASDYYFYLTDSKGVTHYAVTNTQHEENIAKYLN